MEYASVDCWSDFGSGRSKAVPDARRRTRLLQNISNLFSVCDDFVCCQNISDYHFTKLQNSITYFPGWNVLQYYVLPEEIPFWHIAAVLNAVLAWIILFL